jgi:hypothetical protein
MTVLRPIPGTPLRLSDVSPTKARARVKFLADIPKLSKTYL